MGTASARTRWSATNRSPKAPPSAANQPTAGGCSDAGCASGAADGLEHGCSHGADATRHGLHGGEVEAGHQRRGLEGQPTDGPEGGESRTDRVGQGLMSARHGPGHAGDGAPGCVCCRGAFPTVHALFLRVRPLWRRWGPGGRRWVHHPPDRRRSHPAPRSGASPGDEQPDQSHRKALAHPHPAVGSDTEARGPGSLHDRPTRLIGGGGPPAGDARRARRLRGSHRHATSVPARRSPRHLRSWQDRALRLSLRDNRAHMGQSPTLPRAPGRRGRGSAADDRGRRPRGRWVASTDGFPRPCGAAARCLGGSGHPRGDLPRRPRRALHPTSCVVPPA